MSQGIVYQVTNMLAINNRGQLRSRGEVLDYHAKPNPLHLGKTNHKVDVAGLKKREREKVIVFNGDEGEYTSRFTIGFEVEKNALSRGAVREYELFCGFERDGSCGYEAVTHILPLLPASSWRNKVFDMMHKAEKIIDDRWSRSSDKGGSGNYTCGGHITIGVEGMNGEEILKCVRGNMGIVYAIFRHRLSNTFCKYNLRLQSWDERHQWYNGIADKYRAALPKGNVLEFRIPSKFESVKQMMRRYELFYEIVNFSVNNPNGKHETLLKIVRPIICSMYEGDVDKIENVFKLSESFREFILEGTVCGDILRYV